MAKEPQPFQPLGGLPEYLLRLRETSQNTAGQIKAAQENGLPAHRQLTPPHTKQEEPKREHNK